MKNKTSIYVVADSEVGNWLGITDTYQKAFKKLKEFEKDDLKNDIYEKDFYEIQEVFILSRVYKKFIKFLN